MPGGVRALGGQLEVDDGAEEAVRDLDQDARAVTGVRLGARGTTVLEVDQRGDGLLDDVARLAAVHVDDEGDATGVVLVGGVVQAVAARRLLHSLTFMDKRPGRRSVVGLPFVGHAEASDARSRKYHGLT